jgi:hypothetical protein
MIREYYLCLGPWSRTMILVRNRTANDCGITALAMVADIGYDDALNVAIEVGAIRRVRSGVSQSRGITVTLMAAMLERQAGRPWNLDRPRKCDPLYCHIEDPRLERAILLIREGTAYGHWIACRDHVVHDSNHLRSWRIADYPRAWWTLFRVLSPSASGSK